MTNIKKILLGGRFLLDGVEDPLKQDIRIAHHLLVKRLNDIIWEDTPIFVGEDGVAYQYGVKKLELVPLQEHEIKDLLPDCKERDDLIYARRAHPDQAALFGDDV